MLIKQLRVGIRDEVRSLLILTTVIAALGIWITRPQGPIMLSITSDGMTQCEGEQIESAALAAELARQKLWRNLWFQKSTVVIAADVNATPGQVIAVIRNVGEAGIEKFAMRSLAP